MLQSDSVELRLRALSASFYRTWRRYGSHVIAMLQSEVDHYALEIGDYVEAMNEAWQRWRRSHATKYFYVSPEERAKLYKTLPRTDFSAVWHKVFRKVLDHELQKDYCIKEAYDTPDSLAFYFAARKLGMAYEGAPGSPYRGQGCDVNGSNVLYVATFPASVPDGSKLLVISPVKSPDTPVPVFGHRTGVVQARVYSNVDVIQDGPHSLAMNVPVPCSGEVVEDYANLTLLPGMALPRAESILARDSLLIPSYSTKARTVIHWWFERPLTLCETLQIQGFTREEAEELRYQLRRPPKVNVHSVIFVVLSYIARRERLPPEEEPGEAEDGDIVL